MDNMSDRMGGRNKLVIAGVVFLVGLAFLIAGAVMLGIGIHKAKQQAVCAPSDATTTAATAGTGATAGTSTSTTTQPVQPTGKVTPYYMTLQALSVDPNQLQSDYAGTVKQFQAQLQQAAPDQPIVTLLSLTPPSSSSNAAGSGVPTALVAFVYPDANVTQGQLEAAVQKDGQATVDQTQNGNTYQYPPSPDQQLCLQDNPTVVTGTTPSRGTGTTPSAATTTPFTGSTTTGITTTPATTPFSIAPPGDYTPCFARVVFVLDQTMAAGNFRRLTNFLVNQVFAGNWNHLERLAVAGITNKLNEYLMFGDLADDGKQNLTWLQGYITGLKTINVNLGLPFAFQSLREDFNADNYGEVHYVVFLGSLTTQDVRALQPIAKRLQAKGQLTVIGVGGNVVAKNKYLEALSNNTAYWTNPSQPFPGDWNEFFWKTAYKCITDPPPAPSTIGTVQPVTRGPTTPTTPTPPLPCAGRFVVIADVSETLDINAYTNEINFVGSTLFANSFFTRFDRLAIGSYNQQGPTISEFGEAKNADGVAKVLSDSIIKDGEASLRRALAAVANQWYVTDQTTPVVVLVFISKITQDIVNQAKLAAQPLYDNNARLVLVGLSKDLDLDLMNQITNGAGTTAVNWDAKLSKAPTRFPNLFTTLWCPATNDTEDFDVVREKREIADLQAALPPLSIFDDADYPCPGNIIFVTDLANDLTEANFNKEIAFLKNQVFGKPWTQLERLALISYSQRSSVDPYETFVTLAQVVGEIGLYHYYADDAPLLRGGIAQITGQSLTSLEQPAHAIVFVASITQAIVNDVKPSTDSAREQGCTFTFVALGTSLDMTLLNQLADNVIVWDIDNTDAPDNWEQQFWTAYGCQDQPPTQSTAPTRRTRPTRPPTTTTPPVPFVPCNDEEQIQVNFFVDISIKNLNANEFNTIRNFLTGQLFNYWTHFERLVLGFYSRYTIANDPYTFVGLSDVIKTVNEQGQDDDDPSLLRLLVNMLNYPTAKIPTYRQVYIVFVTEVSDNTVNYIKNNITRLDGQLTFVALKDVNIDNLDQLSPYVIQWTDLSKPAPDNWNDDFWEIAYGCGTSPPATATPLTFAPTQPTQPGQSSSSSSSVKPTTAASTSTQPTTKLTARTRMTFPSTVNPSSITYSPCKKFLAIIYDNSNNLSADKFSKLRNMFTQNLFPTFTHYERLVFSAFNNILDLEAPGAAGDLTGIQNYLDSTGQSDNAPSLRSALATLANSPTWETTLDQVIVLFISRLTDKDVQYSQQFADQIRDTARLVLISISPDDVTQDQMEKLADYAFTLDLDNVPSNLLDQMNAAYDCTT